MLLHKISHLKKFKLYQENNFQKFKLIEELEDGKTMIFQNSIKEIMKLQIMRKLVSTETHYLIRKSCRMGSMYLISNSARTWFVWQYQRTQSLRIGPLLLHIIPADYHVAVLCFQSAVHHCDLRVREIGWSQRICKFFQYLSYQNNGRKLRNFSFGKSWSTYWSNDACRNLFYHLYFT